MTNWLPISELFDFEKGTVQSTKATTGEYTFITAGEDWKTHNEYTHDCEALVFAMGASGSLGRTHYVSGKFISSDLCFILTPKKDKKIDLLFYYRIFNFIRADIVKETARGTSKLAINQRNFGKYKLPYFDFDHQMLFRDKLDNLNSQKEKLILELELQQNFLMKLRQSILQDAIEGKLTAEWRKQNPVIKGDPNTDAHALLDQIKAERQGLIAEGKIKKEKPLPPINPNEIPFELPEGWVWCKVDSLISSLSNDIRTGPFGSSLHKHEHKKEGKPVWGIESISKRGLFTYKNKIFVDELKAIELKSFAVKSGDIIISRSGTVGELCLIPDNAPDGFISTNLMKISLNKEVVDPSYFIFLFKGTKSIDIQLFNLCSGSSRLFLTQTILSKLLFPLPPLREQLMIIQLVINQYNYLNKLDLEISDRKLIIEALMQAVLKEAFTPT